jgi:hypothetical protein
MTKAGLGLDDIRNVSVRNAMGAADRSGRHRIVARHH